MERKKNRVLEGAVDVEEFRSYREFSLGGGKKVFSKKSVYVFLRGGGNNQLGLFSNHESNFFTRLFYFVPK